MDEGLTTEHTLFVELMQKLFNKRTSSKKKRDLLLMLLHLVLQV